MRLASDSGWFARPIIRRLKLALAVAALPLLAACSPTNIEVSHAELGAEGHTLLNFAYAEDRRETYTTEDEKVTFAVRLGYNLVGYYTAFRVHWIAPTGATYLDAPGRTAWGSNQALVAELPLKGTAAVRLPGKWKVRLLWEGKVLAEREFLLLDARSLAHDGPSPAGAIDSTSAAPEATALAASSPDPDTGSLAAVAAPAADGADPALVEDPPGAANSSYAGLGTLALPTPELDTDDASTPTPPGPLADPEVAPQAPEAAAPSGRILWVDIRTRLESDAGIAEVDALTSD